MNWNAVRAIVRRDLKVVFQNKGASTPIIMAPIIIMGLVLPGMALMASKLGDMVTSGLAWMDKLVQVMPAGLQSALSGYDAAQRFTVLVMVYGAAALYLLLPLLVVVTIAADSFAGEKERKTLEALLYTPTTDWELLLGKLLSAWLLAMGVSWSGFLLYTVMGNLAAWPIMGRLFFPTTGWVILAVWVAPGIAAFGLGGMVLISAHTRTFQAANQLAGMVVLPILMLGGSLLLGVMAVGAWLVALSGLAVWAIAAELLWVGKRGFRRTVLATQI